MRRWTLTAVVALALVVGACGGGGSKKASTTGSTEAGKTATSQASSSGSSEFCTKAVDYQKRFADTFQKDLAAAAANPAAIKDALKRDYAALKQVESDLVSRVPSAIKADVDTVFGVINSFYDALSKVDFDFTKVVQSNPQLLSSLQDPKFAAAAQRLSTYFADTCHITSTTSK
jgi:hypothetical protein